MGDTYRMSYKHGQTGTYGDELTSQGIGTYTDATGTVVVDDNQ